MSIYRFLTVVFLIILLCANGSTATATMDSELLKLKKRVDIDNIRFCTNWIIHDLKNKKDLSYLADTFELKKLESLIFLTEEAVNYKSIICSMNSGYKDLSKKHEKGFLKLLHHSLDYLALKKTDMVCSLSQDINLQPVKSESINTQTIKAKLEKLIKPIKKSAIHTITDLNNYVSRRLGYVPIRFAHEKNLDIYLFTSPAKKASVWLRKKGFTKFYDINSFFSKWGKRVFLAYSKEKMALVYTDVFGDFMVKHLLHMLCAFTLDNKGIDPNKIIIPLLLGKTKEDIIVDQYEKEIDHLIKLECFSKVKKENITILFGYLDIYGREILKKAVRLGFSKHESLESGNLFVHKIKGKKLEFDLFGYYNKSNEKGIIINIGAMHSFYGDMTADIVSLFMKKGIKRVFFTGSAGAVDVNLGYYDLAVPEKIADYTGKVVSNNVSNLFIENGIGRLSESELERVHTNTFHQGVISPVVETANVILEMKKKGVSTLDVELAEIMGIVQKNKGKYGAAFIITDKPGSICEKSTYDLDRIDYSRKYENIPLLLEIIADTLRVRRFVIFSRDEFLKICEDYIPEFSRSVNSEMKYLIKSVIKRDLMNCDYFKITNILESVFLHAKKLKADRQWKKLYYPQMLHALFYVRAFGIDNVFTEKEIKEILDATIENKVEIKDISRPEKSIFIKKQKKKKVSNQRLKLSGQCLKFSDMMKDKGFPKYEKRSYKYLFRGSKAFEKREKREHCAIETMLEYPGAQIASSNVWTIYSDNLKQGMEKKKAYDKAVSQVSKNLDYLVETDTFDSEIISAFNRDTGFYFDDFIFLAGKYETACLYGEIVFIIDNSDHRGLPLNEFSQMTGFYDALPVSWLLSLKGMWIFGQADFGEYVLPVEIPHKDIVGLDVRTDRKFFSNAKVTGQPGKLLRRYRKIYVTNCNEPPAVLMLDEKDSLIGVFSKKTIDIEKLKKDPELKEFKKSESKIPDNLLQFFKKSNIFWQSFKP